MDRQRAIPQRWTRAGVPLLLLAITSGCASSSTTVTRHDELHSLGLRSGAGTVELAYGTATASVTVHWVDGTESRRIERPRSVQVDWANLWIYTNDGRIYRAPVARVERVDIEREVRRGHGGGGVNGGAVAAGIAYGMLCVLAAAGGATC